MHMCDAQMSSGVLKDKWCLITGAGKGVVRADPCTHTLCTPMPASLVRARGRVLCRPMQLATIHSDVDAFTGRGDRRGVCQGACEPGACRTVGG